MIHLLWASLAVPVLIHLVHRRKARRIPFSTLRFVRMVDQRVARRQRLKELLLLALRLALLAALIGALYRPMIRSATFQGAGVRTAAAIVLDNTYSMRAVREGTRRFDRALKAAGQILDGLTHGDAVSIVLLDGPADAPAELSTALAGLRSQIDSVQCGYGTAEAAGAIRRAVQSLAQATQARKEIYVISDFQRVSWTAAVEELQAELAEDMPVFLVDVGGEVGENVSLDSAEFGLKVQVAGAASEVFCTLSNTGAKNVERELSLFLDGEKVAEQNVGIAAGGMLTTSLRPIFGRTGETAMEVRLAPDELDADNARYATVTVHDRLLALLVNGDASGAPYLDETLYVDLALSAPSVGGRVLSPIETRTVTPAEFLNQRLQDYACVLLANVPRVSDLWVERLRRYVTDGGGLILFLGDRVDAASYNPMLGGDLLPGTLGDVVESAEGVRVRRYDGTHPVFHALADYVNVERTRVERFFGVSPAEGTGVLAELESGPLLLERKVGAGIVLLWTSSADMDWNNLPARPFFLPLLHQMVYYAGRPTQRGESVTVGMPCALDLPETGGALEVAFYGPGQTELDEPLAVLEAAPAEGGGRVEFSGTGQPGVYRALYSVDGAEQARLFAVNVDPRESQLDCLAPQEVAQMLGARFAKVVRDPDELALVVRREREGLPLWDYLFALAIVVAVAESFVGNVWLRH